MDAGKTSAYPLPSTVSPSLLYPHSTSLSISTDVLCIWSPVAARGQSAVLQSWRIYVNLSAAFGLIQTWSEGAFFTCELYFCLDCMVQNRRVYYTHMIIICTCLFYTRFYGMIKINVFIICIWNHYGFHWRRADWVIEMEQTMHTEIAEIFSNFSCHVPFSTLRHNPALLCCLSDV